MPGTAALPPWQARASITQRKPDAVQHICTKHRMPCVSCGQNLFSLPVFCSCHVRIRYNQVCYDGYTARKEKSVGTQGRNPQLKARSASFENNILDSIGSKYNQKFTNDTDSLLPVYMTYLVISL